MREPREITILNEGWWSIDFDDVTVEALERRFELSAAIVVMNESCCIDCDSKVCEPICKSICETICSPDIT